MPRNPFDALSYLVPPQSGPEPGDSLTEDTTGDGGDGGELKLPPTYPPPTQLGQTLKDDKGNVVAHAIIAEHPITGNQYLRWKMVDVPQEEAQADKEARTAIMQAKTEHEKAQDALDTAIKERKTDADIEIARKNADRAERIFSQTINEFEYKVKSDALKTQLSLMKQDLAVTKEAKRAPQRFAANGMYQDYDPSTGTWGPWKQTPLGPREQDAMAHESWAANDKAVQQQQDIATSRKKAQEDLANQYKNFEEYQFKNWIAGNPQRQPTFAEFLARKPVSEQPWWYALPGSSQLAERQRNWWDAQASKSIPLTEGFMLNARGVPTTQEIRQYNIANMSQNPNEPLPEWTKPFGGTWSPEGYDKTAAGRPYVPQGVVLDPYQQSRFNEDNAAYVSTLRPELLRQQAQEFITGQNEDRGRSYAALAGRRRPPVL